MDQKAFEQAIHQLFLKEFNRPGATVALSSQAPFAERLRRINERYTLGVLEGYDGVAPFITDPSIHQTVLAKAQAVATLHRMLARALAKPETA